MSLWYCSRDNKNRFGPFTATELKSLAMSGQLATTDLVWKEGGSKWVPARKVRGLFAYGSFTLAKAKGVSLLKAGGYVLVIFLAIVIAGFTLAFSVPAKKRPVVPATPVAIAPVVTPTAPDLVEPPGALDLVVPSMPTNFFEPTVPELVERSMCAEPFEPMVSGEPTKLIEPLPPLPAKAADVIEPLKVNSARLIGFNGCPKQRTMIFMIEPVAGMPDKVLIPCGTLLRAHNTNCQNLMVMRTCEFTSKTGKIAMQCCCVSKHKGAPNGTYSFERLQQCSPLYPLVKTAESLERTNLAFGCKQARIWGVSESLRKKRIE